MKKLLFTLIFMAAGAAWAAQTVPGDVLVIFNNPFPDEPVTAASLAQGTEGKAAGKHRAYVESVAESLDAKVACIYETLSIDDNNIMALFHTDTKSEGTLWVELRMRPDVKGASLNHVQKLNFKRPGGAR